MEIYSIKRLEEMKAEAGSPEIAKDVERVIKLMKPKLPHNCGSEEYYHAPIVHIRCAKCNQPL